MGGEVDKLEEELGDKPGTTIGTKFSVLHSIRIQFSNRMSIHVHRKAFLALKTAGVSSRTFFVKNLSSSLT